MGFVEKAKLPCYHLHEANQINLVFKSGMAVQSSVCKHAQLQASRF